MAIKIVINVSKKIPGPTDYSSVQASCSIESECTSGDPVADSVQLYSQAELAVDAQLGLRPGNKIEGENTCRDLGYHRTLAQHKLRVNGNGRKSPPATDNQLRLLKRLMDKDPVGSSAILAFFKVDQVDDLTVPQASEAIDQLKAKA